jgi:polyisoprenoid-binding protein YceI
LIDRRFRIAFLSALLAGALAACGSTTTQNAAPTSAPADSVVPPTAAPAAPTSAPDPTAAAAPATDATTQPAAGATAAPAASAAGTRTFTIVPEQTEASYEVQEQFLDRDLPNMAVGKTNAVQGELQFSTDGKPTGKVTKITVDLRSLASDQSRRDNMIRRRWLESETYPFAEFTSTDVQGVPESYVEGQEVNFKLLGDMTIRNVTKPVTFDVRGNLTGDTITGTATTQVMMKDFGFDPPNVAGMLTVKDGVLITVNFTAKEAG